MKKLIVFIALLCFLPTLNYAAIPISQETTVTETVVPVQKKEIKIKKVSKAKLWLNKMARKFGVPEGGSGSGLFNGLSFGSAILGILLVAVGGAFLAVPLAIAAVVLGIIGLSKGESLQGLGIAGIVLGGTMLLLLLLAILIIAAWAGW